MASGERNYLALLLFSLPLFIFCRPHKPSVLLRNVNAKVCTHAHCNRVSDEILRSLNESVNPCDDFFQYSCGEWIKRQKIPKGRNQFSAITQLSLNNEKLIMEALETDNPSDIPPLRMVKDFYRSCMDTHTIDKRGYTPAKDFVEKLNSWALLNSSWNAREWDFYKTLKLAHETSPAEIFFVIDVIPNPVKHDKNKREVILASIITENCFVQPAYLSYIISEN